MGRHGQRRGKAATLSRGATVSCKMETGNLKSHTPGEHLGMGVPPRQRKKQPDRQARPLGDSGGGRMYQGALPGQEGKNVGVKESVVGKGLEGK